MLYRVPVLIMIAIRQFNYYKIIGNNIKMDSQVKYFDDT